MKNEPIPLMLSMVHGSTGPEKEDYLYSEEITGPQGARFTLFEERYHSKEDRDKATRYLKRNFDVVKIYIQPVI